MPSASFMPEIDISILYPKIFTVNPFCPGTGSQDPGFQNDRVSISGFAAPENDSADTVSVVSSDLIYRGLH